VVCLLLQVSKQFCKLLQAPEPQLAQEELRDADPTPLSTARQDPSEPSSPLGTWEPGLVPSLMPA